MNRYTIEERGDGYIITRRTWYTLYLDKTCLGESGYWWDMDRAAPLNKHKTLTQAKLKLAKLTKKTSVLCVKWHGFPHRFSRFLTIMEKEND